MTKLFISFTGTLQALSGGIVSVDDLNEGLFVFGCTRNHALNPGAAGEHVESVVREHPELHRALCDALLLAEAAGRVRWRTLEQGNASFELVDELLVANGYKKLNRTSEMDPWTYSYPAVERFSMELPVVWHR